MDGDPLPRLTLGFRDFRPAHDIGYFRPQPFGLPITPQGGEVEPFVSGDIIQRRAFLAGRIQQPQLHLRHAFTGFM